MAEEPIEAILARCLVEPAFLEAVRADARTALAAYDLEGAAGRQLASADWEKVRRFSGFIGKVQHNHLWESFPCTRQLLRDAGIELEVFAEFRARQLSKELQTAERDERIRRFLDFTDEFLSERARGHAGIREVLRHERAVWEVRLAAAAAAETGGGVADLEALGWAAFQRLVPRISGALRIRRAGFDVAGVAARVRAGAFEGRWPARRPRILAYWCRGIELRVLEPDAVTAHLLGHVDGRHSVRAVISAVRRSGLERVPPRAFREFFEGAARIGILELRAKES